jgi:hypothetical protein
LLGFRCYGIASSLANLRRARVILECGINRLSRDDAAPGEPDIRQLSSVDHFVDQRLADAEHLADFGDPKRLAADISHLLASFLKAETVLLSSVEETYLSIFFAAFNKRQ